MIGKRLRKKNLTTTLNTLYTKEKEICPAYISNHNSTSEKQIILLMILNEEKEGWHYLAVNNLSALLRGITSKHHGNLYCLNCLHSFRTEDKLKSHEKVRENKDSCGFVMPSEKCKILEFKHYMKTKKMPFMIYADIEYLIKKIDGCENNLEKSSTTKMCEHIPCGYSISTIWRFDHIEDKHTLYRGKDFMKKLCESLREQAKRINDFEKKKMLLLTSKELKSYEEANKCFICWLRFFKKSSNYKSYRKFGYHCHYTGKYRGAAHSICNLKVSVPNEIPVVFHRGSNYDYHFVTKELANKFEGEFECIGENNEIYKTFPVPIKKRIIKIDKDGNKIDEIISYKIKFIDSAIYLASSLSNLVDNLTEGIHKTKCKDCGCFLEYKSEGILIIYEYLSCNGFY